MNVDGLQTRLEFDLEQYRQDYGAYTSDARVGDSPANARSRSHRPPDSPTSA
jgi:hypothetical protein